MAADELLLACLLPCDDEIDEEAAVEAELAVNSRVVVVFLSVLLYESCCEMNSSFSWNCSMPMRLLIVSFRLSTECTGFVVLLKSIVRPSKKALSPCTIREDSSVSVDETCDIS